MKGLNLKFLFPQIKTFFRRFSSLGCVAAKPILRVFENYKSSLATKAKHVINAPFSGPIIPTCSTVRGNKAGFIPDSGPGPPVHRTIWSVIDDSGAGAGCIVEKVQLGNETDDKSVTAAQVLSATFEEQTRICLLWKTVMSKVELSGMF